MIDLAPTATDGDFGDPGGSCEKSAGRINNHQATDEAVTPGRAPDTAQESRGRCELSGGYLCPMNGPDNDLDTAQSFRLVPGSSA